MASLIRKPKLRLPSDAVERHTTWIEIFFDLIFAVIFIQLSDRLMGQLNWLGIGSAFILFLPVLWTWASYTVFAARFDNDDFIHWLMTFMIMFAGIIMALHIPTATEKGATGFSIGFLGGQMVLLLLYARTAFDVSTPKNLVKLYTIGFGLAAVLWVVSFFFATPYKFILWMTGMVIYILVPWSGRKRILSKAPLDTVYIPERFAAFTLIIVGQMIASVVFGLKPTQWNLAALLVSVLAFLLAIVIWGAYYRSTLIADYKCTLGTGQPFIYTHIPLIMSLIVVATCVGEFIKNPTVIAPHTRTIFCVAIVAYLLSFFFLQQVTHRKNKQRKFLHAGTIAFTLPFFFVLSPVVILLGIVGVFLALFIAQYCLERPHGPESAGQEN